MNRRSMRRVMVLLTMAYGAGTGVLAILGVPRLGIYCIVGAVALGLGWTATAMLSREEVRR